MLTTAQARTLAKTKKRYELLAFVPLFQNAGVFDVRVAALLEKVRERAWEIEEVLKMIEDEDLPVIVFGDLNSTPYNWVYARLASPRSGGRAAVLLHHMDVVPADDGSFYVATAEGMPLGPLSYSVLRVAPDGAVTTTRQGSFGTIGAEVAVTNPSVSVTGASTTVDP